MNTHGFLNIEDTKGRWWRHVRGTRWFRSDDDRHSISLGCEILTLPKEIGTLSVKVSTTGEETLDLGIGLGPIIRTWWKIDATRNGRMIRLPSVRFTVDLGVTHARWAFGSDDGGWARNAPMGERLRRNSLTWWRIGRYRREQIEGDPQPLAIALPEAVVPAEAKLCESRWAIRVGPYKLTRTSKPWLDFMLPRRFDTISREVEVTVPTGLPFQGKGENSWDCGDDAIYGYGVSVGQEERRPFDKAAEHGRQRCMEYRRRYGNPTTFAGGVPDAEA